MKKGLDLDDKKALLAAIDKKTRVVYRVPSVKEFIDSAKRGDDEKPISSMTVTTDEEKQSLGLNDADLIVPEPRPEGFDPAPHKGQSYAVQQLLMPSISASDVVSVDSYGGDPYAGQSVSASSMPCSGPLLADGDGLGMQRARGGQSGHTNP